MTVTIELQRERLKRTFEAKAHGYSSFATCRIPLEDGGRASLYLENLPHAEIVAAAINGDFERLRALLPEPKSAKEDAA